MAHEVVTKWRCDRCGREAATSTESPPVDWRWAVLSTGAATNARGHTFELCPGCAGQVARLLEPVDRPGEALQ